MTDNEIIKALERCGTGYGNCNDCPYDVETCITTEGATFLMKDALDLINRQQAEIERLNEKIIAKDKSNYYFMGQLSMAREQLKNAKSEAIKEFVERLKKERLIDRGYEILSEGTIDDLVKEMTEKDFKEE